MKFLKGLIYLAKNLINNKVYIGQTINSLTRRKGSHLLAARMLKDNLYFHQAIRKYGEESFEWKILKEINLETKEELRKALNEAEIFFISLYDSKNPQKGYNLTSGGDSWQEQAQEFWNDAERSSYWREKLKERITKYWSDPQNREKHQKYMLNFYQTAEGKEVALRHSEFMKNYYNGPEARKNKAKTSKWFVKAISPSGEEMVFISSKEPNLFFGKDIHLRGQMKEIGDKWIPTNRSSLFGWSFEAIPKQDI